MRAAALLAFTLSACGPGAVALDGQWQRHDDDGLDELVLDARKGDVVFAERSATVDGTFTTERDQIEVRGAASDCLLEPFDQILDQVFASRSAPTRGEEAEEDDSIHQGLNPLDVDPQIALDKRAWLFGCDGEPVVRTAYAEQSGALFIAPFTFDRDVAVATLQLGCVGQPLTTISVRVARADAHGIRVELTRPGGETTRTELNTSLRNEADGATLKWQVGARTVLELRQFARDFYAERDGTYLRQ